MASVTRAAHGCGRDRDLGSRALRGRRAGRSARRRRRHRGRLRLQVPERRPRRAGVHLGPSAPYGATRSRGLAPATVRMARSRATVCVRAALSAGERHSAIHLRHAAGAVAWRRSNAASTRVLAADDRGGMAAIRSKSLALTDLFMRLVDERCAGHGFTIVTPREPGQRGSQVSIRASAKMATRSCRR